MKEKIRRSVHLEKAAHQPCNSVVGNSENNEQASNSWAWFLANVLHIYNLFIFSFIYSVRFALLEEKWRIQSRRSPRLE